MSQNIDAVPTWHVIRCWHARLVPLRRQSVCFGRVDCPACDAAALFSSTCEAFSVAATPPSPCSERKTIQYIAIQYNTIYRLFPSQSKNNIMKYNIVHGSKIKIDSMFTCCTSFNKLAPKYVNLLSRITLMIVNKLTLEQVWNRMRSKSHSFHFKLTPK